PGEAAEERIQLALKGGGPHNITCIVADVVDLSTLPRSEEAPSTAPQIVGSAARDRHAPTAASGPAAKAAALTREEPEAPYEDEDFSGEAPPRRRPWPARVALVLLLALLGGVLWAGYSWSQPQLYVASDGTTVVLDQCLSPDLGPISMPEPVVLTESALEVLPEVTRQQ